MNEELKKIRKSINVLQAKVAFQREASQAVEKAVGDLAEDVDSFIEAFDAIQQRNEERFRRVEQRLDALEDQ
ncbi:MAG: hypothetical protein AAF944_12830 [Bacteroidota bacterium]